MKTLWVDLETTGLDKQKDTIIELAAIYEDKIFHEYCKPDNKPENFNDIEEITGITWEFLEKNGLNHNQLYSKFKEFIDLFVDRYNKKDKIILCGYNTRFDANFLRKLFLKNFDSYYGSYFFSVNIDVMSEVASLLSTGKMDILDNYKLETVCNYFDIHFNAHSAIEDIKATKQLYNIIQEKRTWTKEEEKQKKDIGGQAKTLIM